MVVVPRHGQNRPLLVVVAVALINVFLKHSENSDHADGLLPSAVYAVFVSIQHTQGVVGRLQTVETGLDEIFVNLNLNREARGTNKYHNTRYNAL